MQVSAQILALISQHAANGECEKISYDDFYVEVLPDSAALSAAPTWLPAASGEVHVIGDTSFSALPAVLRWAVKVSIRDLFDDHLSVVPLTMFAAAAAAASKPAAT